MKIFVLNCGSSSVKYKLYDMEGKSARRRAVERVGQENATITHQSTGKEKITKTMPIHTVAFPNPTPLLHPETVY